MQVTSGIYKKLFKIQKEIGTVKKGATNPFYNSKYVEINALLEAVKPVLDAHGVLLMQPLTNVEGKPAITTVLVDTDDGSQISYTSMVTNIEDAQKMGASFTYHRRYSLISLIGLGAEDDDANSVSKSAKPKKAAPKKASTSSAVRNSSF